MKRRKICSIVLVCLLTLTPLLSPLVPLAVADPGHPGDDHGGFVTDDPTGDDLPLGFDGAGISSVEKFLGNQPPANRGNRKARNISLVGALQLDPFNEGVHADVAGFEKLAFIGKWRGLCPGTGVDIIDISNPAAPVKIADTLDYPDTSMEDMQAIRIKGRAVLAIGLQDCGNDPTPGVGKGGLELYDISDPANPQLLSFFDTDAIGDVGGVHELDLTQTPGGRTLALLAVPNLEAVTSDDDGLNGIGDLLILDISDPANPALIAEWGVLDEPALGVSFYLGVRQGADARTLLHSVRANQNGTLAYLSYWDAGVIILDISDPANPVFRGRTSFALGEEGNAHSVDEARGGNILIQADEDFAPFEFVFTSNAFEGSRVAIEGAFTFPIVELPGREMSGEVVHIGRGCPADSIAPGSPEDPYLADPAGKIALIERGACRFDHKIARAQLAGAIGAIVYNNAAGGEALVLMGGNNPTIMPDGSLVPITIPGVFVQRSTGLLLRDGTPPVTARAAAEFNGWGYLRIFDIKDPANPIQISTFATPNTNNPEVATLGTWSVHNPEVRGNTVYASWYSDGVRIIDISQPAAPREIGFWTGAGAPDHAPAVNIWSVVPHGDLLLASDRNFGLYILKLKPEKTSKSNANAAVSVAEAANEEQDGAGMGVETDAQPANTVYLPVVTR